jgi:hypothetical protein
MFHRGKIAKRVLLPLATSAALVAAIGVGSASATNGSPSDDATASHVSSSVVAPATPTTIHYSKPGTPPSSVVDAKWCSSDADWAHACFQRHGDVIWVDNDSGEHVKARWENWLRNADGTWVFYRGGECIATTWGWGYCNENLYEDSSHNAVGGHGSGIRLYTCYGACDPDYQWVRNTA